MCGAVGIVNTRGPSSVCDITLPISEDRIIRLCGHRAIQIVVGNNLHVDGLAVRKLHGDRRDVVASVWAAPSDLRILCRDAARHHVVDILPRMLGNQVSQFLIDLRRAVSRNRDIVCGKDISTRRYYEMN
jgi:hypothetical protein